MMKFVNILMNSNGTATAVDVKGKSNTVITNKNGTATAIDSKGNIVTIFTNSKSR